MNTRTNKICTQTPSFFESDKLAIDRCLLQIISELAGTTSRLSKAISHSALIGGKRIRPILVLAAAECFSADRAQSLSLACAVELIHAYSLTHDDLPAMDDDDLRRGQATCHKEFDEATAILAGDALQAMAFELIAEESELSTEKRIKIIQVLSNACGPKGMVLGQAIDFESVGLQLELNQLEMIHRHKTGALIQASVLIGALCGDATSKEMAILEEYAQAIGLAFQVQDDILDVTSSTETLGKRQGADIALNKPTYPALLGLDGAKNKLLELRQQASSSLTRLKRRETTKLGEISNFIASRNR